MIRIRLTNGDELVVDKPFAEMEDALRRADVVTVVNVNSHRVAFRSDQIVAVVDIGDGDGTPSLGFA